MVVRGQGVVVDSTVGVGGDVCRGRETESKDVGRVALADHRPGKVLGHWNTLWSRGSVANEATVGAHAGSILAASPQNAGGLSMPTEAANDELSLLMPINLQAEVELSLQRLTDGVDNNGRECIWCNRDVVAVRRERSFCAIKSVIGKEAAVTTVVELASDEEKRPRDVCDKLCRELHVSHLPYTGLCRSIRQIGRQIAMMPLGR